MLHVYVVTSRQKVVSWFRGLHENVGNVFRVSPFFVFRVWYSWGSGPMSCGVC